MHGEALKKMTEMCARIKAKRKKVLDVGSLDINGTYRPLIEGRGWKYTGLDVQPGPNVDIVAADPFHYPIDDGAYDIVISGSTMEHVTAIWLWVPELVRVLKPGGHLFLITHWQFAQHRYPLDCWRIMPDGMEYLFDLTEQLTDYDIKMHANGDLVARARKVKGK